MDTFWRLIVGYSARALLGLGALVFGAIAVDVGTTCWQVFESGVPDVFLSTPDDGSAPTASSPAQFVGTVAVIMLVAGSMSLACAYFAFRSDKDKSPTD